MPEQEAERRTLRSEDWPMFERYAYEGAPIRPAG
ncbi:MAG: hypothetical protein QOJ85_3896 [Solirubrobacteraceae bacterium]|jgi:hypothetical protein|nr:hypothetical protein [Solirubrobacteraceae bacterium]MEA2245030.1 hypothetical protein [Solirubrobacteraceae bacterium]